MAWYLMSVYSQPEIYFRVTEPAHVPEQLRDHTLCRGYVWPPERLPRVAQQWRRNAVVLRDILLVYGLTVVSERFRTLIEEFEPGVHLFSPMRLLRHNGEPVDGAWFFFNTQADVDCVITNNDPDWFRYSPGVRRWTCLASIAHATTREVVLSAPAIRGRHIWTGSLLGLNATYCSDALAAALRKGRFRHVQFNRSCREIEQDWRAEEQMGPMLGLWHRYIADGRHRLGDVNVLPEDTNDQEAS